MIIFVPIHYILLSAIYIEYHFLMSTIKYLKYPYLLSFLSVALIVSSVFIYATTISDLDKKMATRENGDTHSHTRWPETMVTPTPWVTEKLRTMATTHIVTTNNVDAHACTHGDDDQQTSENVDGRWSLASPSTASPQFLKSQALNS